jgi:hypothetical protein
MLNQHRQAEFGFILHKAVQVVLQVVVAQEQAVAQVFQDHRVLQALVVAQEQAVLEVLPDQAELVERLAQAAHQVLLGQAELVERLAQADLQEHLVQAVAQVLVEQLV